MDQKRLLFIANITQNLLKYLNLVFRVVPKHTGVAAVSM